MASQTYIIVGLGNPGEKYSGTRHNIGFKVVDAIAADFSATMFVDKWDALTAKMNLGSTTIHLVKPTTYMNLSGRAVAKFVDFYKIQLSHLLVIHDDIDMRTARLKLVKGGGTGGHNGIRSIVECLGGNEFYRLKIGIGRPGKDNVSAEIPVERYVLTQFNDEEKERISVRMPDIINGFRRFIEDDPRGSMNFLNSFK